MHDTGRTAEGRHPVRLTALLVVFILLLGCSPLQTLAFLLAPDAIEPPKASLVLPDKEAKVVIVASFADDSVPRNLTLMRADWELAGRVTQLLEERFKENKERVKIVSQSQLKNYTNAHPRWRDEATPQEIGKHFGADWVITLEINSLSLTDRGSANFLYHATTEITVNLTDARKPANEGEVLSEPYQLEYPKSPLERTEMGMAQFRAKFIDRVRRIVHEIAARGKYAGADHDPLPGERPAGGHGAGARHRPPG